MQCMLSAKSAILIKLQFVRRCPFVFCRCVISSFTFTACKCNNYSHRKTPSPLFNNFANHTRADGTSTFTDRKPQLLFHRYRCYQFASNRNIIARHDHLYTFR